jgi:hypothetical protein
VAPLTISSFRWPLLLLAALPACQCLDASSAALTSCADGEACREGYTCCADLVCRTLCEQEEEDAGGFDDVDAGEPVVSCGGLVCAPNQGCDAGACEARDCSSVTCGAGERCSNGGCLPTACGATACASGAVCWEGACVPAACGFLTCPGGTQCARGVCLPTSCGASACPPGQVCEGSDCRDRRCDGLSCASGSRCSAGACVACAATETACADGVDDDCDGALDCADSNCLGQLCDDGSQCTTGEVCQAGGGCDGGTVATCNSPPGQCKVGPGTCNAATGLCVYANADAGTACSDGNPCTLTDTCVAGACAAGPVRTCNTPPSAQCYVQAGACDVVDGGCRYNYADAGTACDDGNPCRSGERCNAAGACGAGTSVPNGTAAGGGGQFRCCGGTAVDISTNEAHCGGCGHACVNAGGWTSSCRPANKTRNDNNLACSSTVTITGRCNCIGYGNCPAGQACYEVQTGGFYDNLGEGLCFPQSAAECPGNTRQSVASCPDYCRY